MVVLGDSGSCVWSPCTVTTGASKFCHFLTVLLVEAIPASLSCQYSCNRNMEFVHRLCCYDNSYAFYLTTMLRHFVCVWMCWNPYKYHLPFLKLPLPGNCESRNAGTWNGTRNGSQWFHTGDYTEMIKEVWHEVTKWRSSVTFQQLLCAAAQLSSLGSASYPWKTFRQISSHSHRG